MSKLIPSMALSVFVLSACTSYRPLSEVQADTLEMLDPNPGVQRTFDTKTCTGMDERDCDKWLMTKVKNRLTANLPSQGTGVGRSIEIPSLKAPEPGREPVDAEGMALSKSSATIEPSQVLQQPQQVPQTQQPQEIAELQAQLKSVTEERDNQYNQCVSDYQKAIHNIAHMNDGNKVDGQLTR